MTDPSVPIYMRIPSVLRDEIEAEREALYPQPTRATLMAVLMRLGLAEWRRRKRQEAPEPR